ncbi:MAG: acyl-ACP--UDP-N-acetylglucosamine O-acyltransferase [Xanthomonadales bacterium]|nr:acyl-ACP--UDP-N-acetylglucosamine O-acyltransferase [Xanthomonadales bacterium]
MGWKSPAPNSCAQNAVEGDSVIHPAAFIDPGARIGARVSIGPGSVIGADVTIGDDTHIGPHVVIEGPTTIGRENRIWQFASLGSDPQDKKFHAERSELVIGDRNVIREFCTFSRGTSDGGGVTRIGDDNWIMAYVHIAHDCQIGDNIIFANAASMAGHVHVGDWVIFGGFTLVHQFCKIGAHAFTSMGSVINRDVPPFITVAGNFASPKGINSEGLRRRGYDNERIAAIKRAYRTLYLSRLPLTEARASLQEQAQSSEDVRQLVDFISQSERSLVR